MMVSRRPLVMGILIAVLMVSLLPTQVAWAQEETSSGVAISLVSIPKHVKGYALVLQSER